MPSEVDIKILYLVQEVTEYRKNQIKLETALETTQLVIFEYDIENDLVVPNKAFAQLFELNVSEPIRVADLINKVHPDDNKTRAERAKTALKSGKINHEVRLVLKDGIKHVRVVGNTFFDENGKPSSVVAMLMDITKDKELLYQVRESEERFKLIADSAPVTIWITDKSDKCTYINQTWLEYTGSDLEDCLNDGWLKYIHPEDRRRVMQEFLNASEERKPFELEYMVENKDGSYGWFLNRAHPMSDKDGNFAGFIGCSIDITEQKEFSRELEKKITERTGELRTSNDQLMKVNMNLEEYAHITSHDLQEPLRKIRTFNSILKDKVQGNEPAEKLVDKIEKSGARMTSLINNILDYSRVSEGTTRFKKVDLNYTLEKVQQDLELVIFEQGATINSNDLGIVKGAGTQMYQLFSNLIKNGIKFNKNKPVITINATDVKGTSLKDLFDSRPRATYKKIEFMDNGIGIDDAQKEKIFKPFKRLHSRNDYSGTGIGLALCKRIIEIHKGFINVKDNKDGGSVFTVFLPVAQQPLQEK
jgi:PAS domain S-box-containing protein